MNLGDPPSFLNVYAPDKGAEKVANFMALGLSPEQVESRLDVAQGNKDNEGDWLLKLFGGYDANADEDATTLTNDKQPRSHPGHRLYLQATISSPRQH